MAGSMSSGIFSRSITTVQMTQIPIYRSITPAKLFEPAGEELDSGFENISYKSLELQWKVYD
jgi:hypothetical protein